MTDRKLKRLLAEKPFLIDDNFSMTGGEAELMLMKNGPLSIEDMLVKARQKDGWKPEFEQMINRILANTPLARWNRLRVNLQTGLQHTWAFHAKAVVTWVIILLLTAVMVFTPVGKAVAESITRFIVDIRDGFILIQTMPDTNDSYNDQVTDDYVGFSATELIQDSHHDNAIIEKEYASIDEFTNNTGYHPVCLVGNQYHLSVISAIEQSDSVIFLSTSYVTDEGITIVLWQDWSKNAEHMIIENEEDKIIKTTIMNGAQVVGYVDEMNHELNASAILEDSVLGITCIGEANYCEILQSLIMK